MSIMHNPNSIKAANRTQYCFPPLMDLHNSLSHTHDSKSVLFWITRKKEVKWHSFSSLAVKMDCL